MSNGKYEEIKTLLASNSGEEIQRGLALIRERLLDLSEEDLQEFVGMLASLFYIDLLDRPDLVPAVNEAITLVADFEARVIPILVESLGAGDLKAQLAIGHAMGRVGESAIDPLVEAFISAKEPEQRIFVLYALGKIDSPHIIRALDIALEAARAEHAELRDTATRVLGKFVESIPPRNLSEEGKKAILERIHENLTDSKAGIRAKAVRSYGKLARNRHLNKVEMDALTNLCRNILGANEFDWDRAYIVRKEAKEILDDVME
jgi:HEAT repeat protein